MYIRRGERGRPEGIFINPFEQGEIEPDLFSKPASLGWKVFSPSTVTGYQAGRSKHWIKVKNRKHQAFARVQEAHRSRIA